MLLNTAITLTASMSASLVSAQILACAKGWTSTCCIVDYDLNIPTTACECQEA